MLLTDRRRVFGRREEDDERDRRQGSLFAPDALAPAPRPPGPTPDPFAPAAAPEDRAAAPPPAPADAPGFAATDYDEAEVVEPADNIEDAAELEPAHVRVPASRSVLAGPTLDDIMSRAWEGLRAEVPTPCPVCHAEIEPSAHGRCGACGSTLR